ncbi:TerC family protein [Urbifossiella limnaea]|uniref:Integral membrane protein TerC family protein n=1 Tax=Urbifossiella limnaea TaxID=2528023 RepID=A0A517XQ74_9BACT|nr:TerC family protein [Urbifossiella limnaea]QDU19648.1 Integral membrane protein TerC family protein [Urbifossiella limnaea]
MRRRPLVTLAVGLVAVALALTGRAAAQNGKDATITVAVPAQDYPKVHADLDDGSATIQGVLKLQAIPLRTDTGTRVIDLKHVRRVTFQRDPNGNSQDLVELADKEIVRGRVTADVFTVEADGKATDYPKAKLREVRVDRDEHLSLLGVLIGLLTLTAMEIVLGVDNIIFLAIVAARLPKAEQPKARKIGLAAALGTRLLLLLSLSFILGLTAPIFTLPDLPLMRDLEAREVSWRDVILLVGGLFLIGKSVYEMHEKLEHAKAHAAAGTTPPTEGNASFASTIATIAVIDIVFSLDSVITAVGMVESVPVMIVAMVLAMGVMLAFAGPVSDFVDRHPTVKVLALSFLILIGVMLVAEGFGQHINKGYIYFAMAFAVAIEFINLKLRGSSAAVAAATAEKPAGA